jgi:hypothetical protein
MLETLYQSPENRKTQDYVLAKIDRVYSHQKASQERKRLLNLVKYRQQLKQDEAGFKRDLNRAISARMREGLGIKVVFNQHALPRSQFIAEFQFLGRRWLISRKRTLLGCQWCFTTTDQVLLTFCNNGNLETRLCYALGKYKHAASHRSGVALLPAAASSSAMDKDCLR